MQPRNDISSFDAILDAKYGAVGTAEREAFRKDATNNCIGQIILDARKQEHMTQSDLAKKVGTDKTYISRIEIRCNRAWRGHVLPHCRGIGAKGRHSTPTYVSRDGLCHPQGLRPARAGLVAPQAVQRTRQMKRSLQF